MKTLANYSMFENIYFSNPVFYLKSFFCLISLFLFSSLGIQAQPANDLCSAAELIVAPTMPGQIVFAGSGSTLTATSTDYPPSCGAGVDNSTSGGVWYTFEGESTTLYSFSTCNSDTDFDTEISLHSITGSGSCMTDLACLAGSDDATCASSGTKSTFSFFTPAGLVPSTYYIYVTGEGTETGDVSLSITFGPPLPVELISFTGEIHERSNRLTWQTASELNTERHVIERSIDGKSEWQEIGSVDAIGFSSDIQVYDFEDFNPPPKGYYRLVSIDFDGTEGFSNNVHLERRASDFIVVGLSPNPTQDYAMLDYNLQRNSSMLFSIIDIHGRVIKEWTVEAQRGSHQEKIDLSNLVNGMYFVQLNNGIEAISKRIFVN